MFKCVYKAVYMYMTEQTINMQKINRQFGRYIDEQIDGQIDRGVYRKIDLVKSTRLNWIIEQIDIQIGRQIDRQMGRQVDRQVDRQMGKQEDSG